MHSLPCCSLEQYAVLSFSFNPVGAVHASVSGWLGGGGGGKEAGRMLLDCVLCKRQGGARPSGWWRALAVLVELTCLVGVGTRYRDHPAILPSPPHCSSVWTARAHHSPPMHAGECSCFPGHKTTPQRMWSLLSKCLLQFRSEDPCVVIT